MYILARICFSIADIYNYFSIKTTIKTPCWIYVLSFIIILVMWKYWLIIEPGMWFPGMGIIIFFYLCCWIVNSITALFRYGHTS